MLSACSYVYADKFTACVQNVRLPNACMHRNVSCVHVRRSARPSWCSSEFQNSAAQNWVKTNGVYYRDVLLTQKLLPVIRHISRNEFMFQQDSAPAHRDRETIELLHRETRPTLFHRKRGHRTVQILTRWTTKSGLQCSSDVDELRHRLLNVWSSIEQDVIDASIDKWRVRLEACVRSGSDVLNTCCKFIFIDIRTSR